MPAHNLFLSDQEVIQKHLAVLPNLPSLKLINCTPFVSNRFVRKVNYLSQKTSFYIVKKITSFLSLNLIQSTVAEVTSSNKRTTHLS